MQALIKLRKLLSKLLGLDILFTLALLSLGNLQEPLVTSDVPVPQYGPNDFPPNRPPPMPLFKVRLQTRVLKK